MPEFSFLAPEFSRHRAALALFIAIVVPVLCAGWLNNVKVYAFPVGTFLLGIVVPLALIAIAFMVPRATEDGPDLS